MRPINATLFVSSFTGTGTIGEYTFSGAAFDNQSDATGNGSLDVTVGCKIYVQPTDGNTGAPISGAVHRYKLTAVSYPDSNSLSGTMLWDEPSAEADSPTNGTYAMLAQATPNHGLSLVPSTSVYANLPSGSDIEEAVMRVDPRAYRAALAAKEAPTQAPNSAKLSKGGKGSASADPNALLSDPRKFEAYMNG